MHTREAVDTLTKMLTDNGHSVSFKRPTAAAPRQGGGEAIRVFEKMMRKKVPRDTITYNALVRACERGGQWQLAFDFMRQMEMK